MGIFQNNLMGAAAAAAAGGGDFYEHQIANSIRMSNDNDSTLKITAGTPTSRRTFTYSWWMKKYTQDNNTTQDSNVFTAGTGGGTYVFFAFTGAGEGNDMTNFNFTGGGYGDTRLRTDMKFRDPASWYHCVMRFDSTQASSSNRVRLYVNGEEPTYDSASVQGAISQDEDFSFLNQSGVVQSWGGISGVGTGQEGCNIYLAEAIFCDGQSYGPDSFGETKNGVWIPKDPSGLTFGDNGYYLKFESSSDLGNDSSGNNNDLTVSGIAAHDQMTDTPTFNSSSNGGNFCTINPVYRGDQTDDNKYGTLSEGNLKHSYSSSSDAARPGTIKVPASGKWYFEYLINGGGGTSSYAPGAGIIDPNEYTMNTASYNAVGAIQYANNLNKVYKGTSISGTYSGSRGSNGDVMGIAVDMDNGAFYVSKNGTFQTIDGGSTGDPTSGASKTGAGATWTPASEFTSGMVPLSAPLGGSTPIITMNFGQDGTFAGEKTAGGNSDTNGFGNFFSAVPSGYSAICTGALTVVDEVDPAQTDDNYPQKLFQAKTYTGTLTGAGVANINHDLGSAPDFIWSKTRNANSTNHMLRDSTRGPNKTISSNTTAAEADKSGNGDMGSTFATSTTFPTNNTDSLNTNTNTFIAWLWRANGGTTSTNSNGSTNSTVQVDPSGHFSIVKFEGQNDSWGNAETIGHGLSSAPTCMILKNYDKSDEWSLFFSDYGNASIGGSNAASNSIVLNSTAGLYTNQSYKGWGGVMPTSTVFTVDGNNNNGASESIVVYCFANCEGYIKSGSYNGNGASSDGTFVYTGFKPAFVMGKGLVSGAAWWIQDNTNSPYNPSSGVLEPNASDDTYTSANPNVDFLSNGFKVRNNNSMFNSTSYDPYVYLAIAHNPFKYATSR